MKVVILGGYGVFGSLLAELLIRDGHQVWLAGRSLDKAQAAAQRLGAAALYCDRDGDLSTLFAPEPDVLIDAAGPFQDYGADPYRIAYACLAAGCNYADLSDAAGFTAGISALDDDARKAGLWVLSGASSVPGLSSSVVAALASDGGAVELIESAILPGNRAPRGLAVMASILGGVGRPLKLWRGGRWRQGRGWTERRSYDLAPGLSRAGYFVDVPDLTLFPEHFRARTVVFRAGLELGLMSRSLAALAGLRRWLDLPIGPRGVALLRWLSDFTYPLGTDRGGMIVRVLEQTEQGHQEARWTLVAEEGEGPYIPGLVARTLCRHAAEITPGARPCLAEVSLSQLEEAATDLAVTFHREDSACPSLFQTAFGDDWPNLPTQTRALHRVQDVESFSGTATVERGPSLPARLIGWFFNFPDAGTDVPVTVTKSRTSKGEIWRRDFDGRRFRSFCSKGPEPKTFLERFWWLTFEVDLSVRDQAVEMPVRRGWFLGLPIPRALLPSSETREYVQDGRFHFDIGLAAPLGMGLIVRYRGHLSPDA
ncbi:MAG: DUF4166 domain-containing protein [Pseudomonadota bacterium]